MSNNAYQGPLRRYIWKAHFKSLDRCCKDKDVNSSEEDTFYLNFSKFGLAFSQNAHTIIKIVLLLKQI